MSHKCKFRPVFIGPDCTVMVKSVVFSSPEAALISSLYWFLLCLTGCARSCADSQKTLALLYSSKLASGLLDIS